jgi:hypothetical protein
MVSKRSLPQSKPQDREKHPESAVQDLNPRVAAVRTRGTAGATEPRTRPASELKELVRALTGFNNDELRQIPVVVPGSRLKPEATYLNLREPARGSFSAPDESYAGKDAWYVAKADVAPLLWNRLQNATVANSAEREGRARQVTQGQNQLRGGRERSERRGGTAVRSVQTPARQHRARGH